MGLSFNSISNSTGSEDWWFMIATNSRARRYGAGHPPTIGFLTINHQQTSGYITVQGCGFRFRIIINSTTIIAVPLLLDICYYYYHYYHF